MTEHCDRASNEMERQDMFEDLLHLEDRYYQDGYRLGFEDGSRAGRIEGRTFGLEKGFEKFFSMGQLHGKSQLLAARLPDKLRSPRDEAREPKTSGAAFPGELRRLPSNERLAKHIRSLSALTELETISTENTEDAVSEFDDRLKRAAAKARLIDNVSGEAGFDGGPTTVTKNNLHKSADGAAQTTAARQMEDFGTSKH